MTFNDTSHEPSALLSHLARTRPPLPPKRNNVPLQLQAAQYLRMSTEQQQYSIQNQTDAIREYAQKHNLQIVKTYADPAKSGLTLRSRTGLMQLLQDTIAAKHAFDVILVYDVSRWGRFQDNDEAACYEFVCRHAGIEVCYVAEPFSSNDLSAALFKNLKRAMAAEYSRDLSHRACQAKARTVSLGFWSGARAPFGFQRMLISSVARRSNRRLLLGERKNLRSDRVILVRGPDEEVRCVRKMFALALTGKMGCIHIAGELNRLGFVNTDKTWITSTVHNMLTNPVYAGYSVCNRTSQKLQSRAVRISPNDWVCTQNAFDPLISEHDFMRVQSILEKRRLNRKWSNERILTAVRSLLARKGRLSGDILDSTHGMPSGRTIREHFGSYRNLYKVVGYCIPKGDAARADATFQTFDLRDRLVKQIETLLSGRVKLLRTNAGQRRVLRIDNLFDVSILVCPAFRTMGGEPRWRLIPGAAERAKPVLICRSQPGNRSFYDFHLIPELDLSTKYRNLKETDPWLERGQRFTSISRISDFINVLSARLNKSDTRNFKHRDFEG
jgi:DNA invertase Pin-like site-specific DNA recombinase